MFGRYDTEAAQNIMVVFEKCDKTKTTCKSDTAIHDWIDEKYIIHVENVKRFIQHDFEEDRLELASVLHWHPLSADIKIDYVNLIQRQHMNMNDYRLNVGSLMSDNEMGFETLP